MSIERLSQQVQFILEIDKLKQVLRQTKIMGGHRPESSAEHSWQLAGSQAGHRSGGIVKEERGHTRGDALV